MTWSLQGLLAGLHSDIEQRLAQAREAFAHAGTKGDASEQVWLHLLQTYLPERYRTTRAFVVDSEGNFSEQLDIVIYDRQYSPFIFTFGEQKIVPAESVYAVFEAKQEMNAPNVAYAQQKVRSVRVLNRTSVDIPTAAGKQPAQPPQHIIGGLLSLESAWKPAFGKPIVRALENDRGEGCLDLGCIATTGIFGLEEAAYVFDERAMAATAFLFKLIARLQAVATVRMIDITAYSRWLK
ncbi:DUF6602 domain-containing protein [Chelativorans sp.]|uniref:DUF6602 domain-containing protein n=1 Tax=Chelativorans sp. TaxID=2203393 RepID=UPI002810F3DD|nr:DUF6602 domain-containing protein [Chelativorans sp.]